jgi:hypothetical protein
MSFFATEEAHAVMLAYAANRGGLPWRDNMGNMTLFCMSMGIRSSQQSLNMPGLGQGRAALKLTPTSSNL